VEASREEPARFFRTVLPRLNEVQRRVVTGSLAVALGRGGKSAVAEVSGMSRNTVIKAEREVVAGIDPSSRQRSVGGSDIKSEVKQPDLMPALDELVHPATRGNPMSFLRWASKSTGKLADELVRQGFKITDSTVGRILKDLGYSLRPRLRRRPALLTPTETLSSAT
jgi:transposase